MLAALTRTRVSKWVITNHCLDAYNGFVAFKSCLSPLNIANSSIAYFFWGRKREPIILFVPLAEMALPLGLLQRPVAIVSISGLLAIVAMILNPTALSPSALITSLLNTSAPYVRNSQTGVSYRGTSKHGVESFHNIFYAQDTSGPNRFAPPVPYTPPRGSTVDATTAGAWCPQGLGGPPLPFTSPITNVSENCLSLRISRASGTKPSSKLPVLVWIHGGSIRKVLPIARRIADGVIRWRCTW